MFDFTNSELYLHDLSFCFAFEPICFLSPSHLNTFFVQLISGANVPIITFEYELGYCRFSCDVSIDRLNNVFNAVLLKAYTELDDRVQPLTIGLKKWAHAAKIIDPRNFKIGSEFICFKCVHVHIYLYINFV